MGSRQGGGREAHIDVFDVNRRLRLIYLNSPGYPTSDSAVVDDFLLDVRKGEGTTSLRLLGSGIPESPTWDQTYCALEWDGSDSWRASKSRSRARRRARSR